LRIGKNGSGDAGHEKGGITTEALKIQRKKGKENHLLRGARKGAE